MGPCHRDLRDCLSQDRGYLVSMKSIDKQDKGGNGLGQGGRAAPDLTTVELSIPLICTDRMSELEICSQPLAGCQEHWVI